MSYWVGMEIDTGAEYPAVVGESWNYTYNVAPMFGLAFNSSEGHPLPSSHDREDRSGPN